MSLFVASLNSGSNGNCYYVGNNDEAILIDGGISCRETEKRLKRLGLSIRRIKGIFVSHEHGDHVHGIPVLSRKFQIPVFINLKTFNQLRAEIREDLVKPITAHTPISIGNMLVTPFPKLHDAVDPLSFIVRNDNVNVGIFTDIGQPCEHVVKNFSMCHAAFLESNYDEGMLESGRYPWSLKQRIRGGQGHLSNTQASELFTNYRPAYMTHLFLSHLSRDNNRPHIAKSIFNKVAGSTEIILAPRNKETRLYHIRHITATRRITTQHQMSQLALF